MEAIKKKMAALKIEKDNALDKMETAENQLRDANLRVEKVCHSLMHFFGLFTIFLCNIRLKRKS